MEPLSSCGAKIIQATTEMLRFLQDYNSAMLRISYGARYPNKFKHMLSALLSLCISETLFILFKEYTALEQWPKNVT